MVPAMALPGREGLFFITAVWEVNGPTTSAIADATGISARIKKQPYQFYLVNFSTTFNEKVIL